MPPEHEARLTASPDDIAKQAARFRSLLDSWNHKYAEMGGPPVWVPDFAVFATRMTQLHDQTIERGKPTPSPGFVFTYTLMMIAFEKMWRTPAGADRHAAAKLALICESQLIDRITTLEWAAGRTEG